MLYTYIYIYHLFLGLIAMLIWFQRTVAVTVHCNYVSVTDWLMTLAQKNTHERKIRKYQHGIVVTIVPDSVSYQIHYSEDAEV